jgi:hypothetical protein
MTLKNLSLIAIISTVFSGCSGCSEDSIPEGSGSRSELKVSSSTSSNSLKNETFEEREERLEREAEIEEVNEEAVSEMNELYEKLREKSVENRVHEDKYESEETTSNRDISSEKEITLKSDESHVEQKPIDGKFDWESVNAQVQKHIEDGKKDYPTPPTPANIGIYDNYDSANVYESDGKPTSSAVGDFPPMPPMMLLNK